MLFDTHCHLQDDAFSREVDAVVRRAEAAGVGRMLVCGYDRDANTEALRLAGRWASVVPAVGYHPHEADTVTAAMLDELAAQAALPVVAAVGEIGLDFYRDHSSHEGQRRILDAQLEIAIDAGKPVSLHTRSAEEAVYSHLAAYAVRSALSAEGRPVGVMHCFGGTLEQALRYVELGFLISLTCTMTYPRNEEARRLASELPLGSLVLETDSPYLPPQHLRGRRNEPANLPAAAAAVAAARRITAAEVAAATTANACRVFAVAVPELAAAR
ncbi:MAG: TatD family hydrolase [Dehalococcoidia bacterium]